MFYSLTYFRDHNKCKLGLNSFAPVPVSLIFPIELCIIAVALKDL